jgi:guanosine-3',5'-bis(diphosphate) 3'-pyrophosphohydrolase
MSPAIERARAFAIKAHADQQYGSHPYSYHLDAVATLLTSFGEQAQIAAYLHDVVEDTDVPIAEIAATFGHQVADCVAVVTDEPGENRRARKSTTNAKLSATSNSLALMVKAADRLANLMESQRCPASGKLAMYRREHEAFRKAAYRPGLCDDLWHHIDSIIHCQPPSSAHGTVDPRHSSFD